MSSRSLITVAERLLNQGAYDEAERLLLDADREYQTSDIDRAMLVGTRAKVRRLRGDISLAVQLHEEEAALFRKAGDRRGQVVSLVNQAALFKESGNLTFADALLSEAEVLSKGLEEPALVLSCLGNQASIRFDLGQFQAAVDLFERVLQMSIELGDVVGVATTWLNQADILRLQGKSAEAADICARAAWFCQELGWPPGVLRAQLMDAVLDHHGRDESRRRLAELIEVCSSRGFSDLVELGKSLLADIDAGRVAGVPSARAASAVQSARDLYRDLQYKAIAWFGPRPAFDSTLASDVAALRERIAYALGEITRVGERKYICPSPWHAAIQLLQLQDRSLSAPGLAQQSMIFRGQSDYRWPIVASLRRQGVDASREKRYFDAFAAVFDRFLQRQNPYEGDGPPVGHPYDPDLHRAAAQHYGVRTDLIDFTTDPCVAIAFGNATPRRGVASVFGLPLRAATRNDLRILLPHPIFSRLYLQRGLFIECNDRYSPQTFRELCVEVVFPVDNEFRVVRNSAPIDLLPHDAYFESLIEHVRALIDGGEVLRFDEAMCDRILDSAGRVPTSIDEAAHLQSDSLQQLWQMMYTLVVLNRAEGGQSIDASAVWELVRGNEVIIAGMTQIVRTVLMRRQKLSDEAYDPFFLDLANVLDAFVDAQDVAPRQDMGGRIHFIRDVPGPLLASVCREFLENDATVEIVAQGDGLWSLIATRIGE